MASFCGVFESRGLVVSTPACPGGPGIDSRIVPCTNCKLLITKAAA
jgi:hypothetical protein